MLSTPNCVMLNGPSVAGGALVPGEPSNVMEPAATDVGALANAGASSAPTTASMSAILVENLRMTTPPVANSIGGKL